MDLALAALRAAGARKPSAYIVRNGRPLRARLHMDRLKTAAPRLVPRLARLLRHHSPALRLGAARVLQQLGSLARPAHRALSFPLGTLSIANTTLRRVRSIWRMG